MYRTASNLSARVCESVVKIPFGPCMSMLSTLSANSFEKNPPNVLSQTLSVVRLLKLLISCGKGCEI